VPLSILPMLSRNQNPVHRLMTSSRITLVLAVVMACATWEAEKIAPPVQLIAALAAVTLLAIPKAERTAPLVLPIAVRAPAAVTAFVMATLGRIAPHAIQIVALAPTAVTVLAMPMRTAPPAQKIVVHAAVTALAIPEAGRTASLVLPIVAHAVADSISSASFGSLVCWSCQCLVSNQSTVGSECLLNTSWSEKSSARIDHRKRMHKGVRVVINIHHWTCIRPH